MVDFTITGTVTDYNYKAIEGLYVEAYYYNRFDWGAHYLGIKKTESNGDFTIKTPLEALLNDFFPAMFLIVRNDHRILLREPKKELSYTHVSDGHDFQLRLEKPRFLYSDQFSHIDWDKLLLNVLDDSSTLSKDDFKNIYPELVETIEKSVYAQRRGWNRIGYSGPQVPERPKKNPHPDVISWDPMGVNT